MSTTRRLVHGNLAQVANLGFNMAAQVAVVPIYLSFWGPLLYGYWLAVVTTVGLITIVDVAHADYLGFSFMQRPVEDLRTRGQILSDSLPVLFIVGAAEAIVGILLLASGILTGVLGLPPIGTRLGHEVVAAIAIMLSLWAIVQNVLGVVGRLLSSLGQFAKTAWWSLGAAIVTAAAPAAVAIAGGGILAAALVLSVVLLALNVCIFFHYRKLLGRLGLSLLAPNTQAGFARYFRALALSSSSIIEFLQQTGIRLIVLPLIGPIGLVQFATHRTIANVAQKGLTTVTSPSEPELMRFAAAHDQARFVGLFMMLIFFIVSVMGPGLVVLQLVAPLGFELWTRGKVAFDGTLLALFSAGIMLFAFAQPFRAIIRGFNHIHDQIVVSFIGGGVLVVAAMALSPTFGVIGAALALPLSEAARTALFIFYFRRALPSHGLDVKSQLLYLSGLALLLSVLTTALIAELSCYWAVWVVFYVCALLATLVGMIKALPDASRKVIGARIPLRRET